MLNYLTLFALAISLVQGLVIPGFADLKARNGPAPLALDFTVESKIGNETVSEFYAKRSNQITRRNSYASQIQDVNRQCYMMNIYLGSNDQKSYVVLDTGSSDLWVPGSSYDHTTSTTAKDTNIPLNIQYADGRTAQGEFYTDSFGFAPGQKLLPNLQFAQSTASGPGFLGIGGEILESTSGMYNNLPAALQAAGLTPKASYSLFLGQEGTSGSVIFGGIDTEKYSGKLVTYPMGEDYFLALTVSAFYSGSNKVSENTPYILDSGYTLSYVSQNVFNLISNTLKADGNTHVSCNQPSDQYFEFDFGSNRVKVPYSAAVTPISSSTCELSFRTEGNTRVLGDSFLRNAYVYYDLTDNQIAIAQAKYTSASNIISA